MKYDVIVWRSIAKANDVAGPRMRVETSPLKALNRLVRCWSVGPTRSQFDEFLVCGEKKKLSSANWRGVAKTGPQSIIFVWFIIVDCRRGVGV